MDNFRMGLIISSMMRLSTAFLATFLAAFFFVAFFFVAFLATFFFGAAFFLVAFFFAAIMASCLGLIYLRTVTQVHIVGLSTHRLCQQYHFASPVLILSLTQRRRVCPARCQHYRSLFFIHSPMLTIWPMRISRPRSCVGHWHLAQHRQWTDSACW